MKHYFSNKHVTCSVELQDNRCARSRIARRALDPNSMPQKRSCSAFKAKKPTCANSLPSKSTMVLHSRCTGSVKYHFNK